MRKDERRALKVTPEFFFQHPECEFHLPEKDQAFEKEKLMVDLRLVRWYFSDSVSHVGYGEEYILKHVLKQGEGWENPRPPYEASACSSRGFTSPVDNNMSLKKIWTQC